MILKYKKIILVFIVAIAIGITYLVYGAFTYNVKRDMSSVSTITDIAAPSFTGIMQIGKSGTNGYLYLYPNDSPPTCNAGAKGTIYADNSENRLKICNGSKWVWLEY